MLAVPSDDLIASASASTDPSELREYADNRLDKDSLGDGRSETPPATCGCTGPCGGSGNPAFVGGADRAKASAFIVATGRSGAGVKAGAWAGAWAGGSGFLANGFLDTVMAGGGAAAAVFEGVDTGIAGKAASTGLYWLRLSPRGRNVG